MNENMKWHDEGGLKDAECWWNAVRKTGEPRENPQKSQNFPPQLSPPPGDTETRTRKPSMDRRAV